MSWGVFNMCCFCQRTMNTTDGDAWSDFSHELWMQKSPQKQKEKQISSGARQNYRSFSSHLTCFFYRGVVAYNRIPDDFKQLVQLHCQAALATARAETPLEWRPLRPRLECKTGAAQLVPPQREGAKEKQPPLQEHDWQNITFSSRLCLQMIPPSHTPV